MAIDQDGGAEIAVDAREQSPQRAVIGFVQAFDPADRVVDRNALAVDFLRVADHAGDGAEPARDPHRTGICERRQAAVEHPRIELIGLTVDVDIAAREVRPHHRMTAAQDAENQLIDKGILRPAQRRHIEPRCSQKLPWIDAAGVRRVEHDRTTPLDRFEHLERGVQFVFDHAHGIRIASMRRKAGISAVHHYAPKRALVHGRGSVTDI